MTNLSILIIDDDQMVLNAIQDILVDKKNIITTDTALSALEAVSKLGSKEQTYDAIICDINMPKMNGIEFSQLFYHNYAIVLITGFLEEDRQEQIMNVCDAYIEKLDALDRIYPALLKAIERRQYRADREAA